MTRHRLVNVEQEAAKRQLRAESARLRRQIDGRLRGVSSQAARLTQWKTYVKRYPKVALGLAFGVGWRLARPQRGRRWSAALIKRLARYGFSALGSTAASAAWRELASVLSGAVSASRK